MTHLSKHRQLLMTLVGQWKELVSDPYFAGLRGAITPAETLMNSKDVVTPEEVAIVVFEFCKKLGEWKKDGTPMPH